MTPRRRRGPRRTRDGPPGRGSRWSLQTGRGEPVHHPTLQHDEHDEHRRHRHQARGHQHRVVDRAVARQRREAGGERHVLGAGGDHERPEQLVPRPQHGRDREHADRRTGQGQHDPPERLERVRAVHPRGLFELGRHVQERGPHQERAERAPEGGDDQGRDRPRQPDVLEDDEDRDDDRLDRDQHRGEEDPEDGVLPREADHGERVAGQGAGDGLADDDQQCDDDAVEEELADRDLVEDGRVVAEVPGQREPLRRVVEGLSRRSEGRRERPQQRPEGEHGSDDQDDQADDAPDGGDRTSPAHDVVDARLCHGFRAVQWIERLCGRHW
ncbi:hypothetical protein BACI9J_190001 [Bacillus altitudinis]|nr:hypothetical protein BACI9J_190001 [Bacillus altitudinis]